MKNPQRTPSWRQSLCIMLAFSCSASAAPTFTVDSMADSVDDKPGDGVCHTVAGTCTLRAAVMEANRASGIGATIDLPAGTYMLQIPATASDDESSGDLNFATPVNGNPLITINGAGAATTIIDANQIDRVMQVEASRSARLHSIALRDGYSPDGGGALVNNGVLALDQVDVVQNTTENNGGAIYNVGQMTLDRVHIGPLNHATLAGGGIFNIGTLALTDSSVFANQ
jgi:CSLREA domain-containing protein